MKIYFNTLLFIAALVLATASCTNENSAEESSSNVPMRFEAQIINNTKTRFSGGEVFEEGDKIGLYVSDDKTYLSGYRSHENELLTYSNEKLSSKETLYFSGSNGDHYFLAYYPYSDVTAQAGTALLPMSVKSDQSKSSDYYVSDFMVAKAKTGTTHQTIMLPFEHKLCVVNLILRTNSKEVYEAAQKSSAITLDNVYTSAYYDVENDNFTDLADQSTITLNGAWEENQSTTTRSDDYSYSLKGMRFIVIPQTIEENKLNIKFGETITSCSFSLGREMESGYSYNISINYNSKTEELEYETYSIGKWPDPIDANTINAEEASYIFRLSSVNFDESLVYRLYNSEEKLMGQICKEYLYVDGVIDASAIVYYPNCNLKAGKVMQIVGESGNVCGGSVCWNNDGTLSYTAGTESSTTNLIVTKTGAITSTSDENNCMSATSKPYTLDDDRDGESSVTKYPIVKIGAQYWMATQLRATRYNDGESLNCNDTDHATTRAGYYTNGDEYFYSTAAVKTLKLAPKGWHLPKLKELAALVNYLGTDAAYKLKAESGWDVSDGIKTGTNVTGFNAKGVGCYYYSKFNEVGYTYGGKFLCIWTMNDAGTDINDTGLAISNTRNDIALTAAQSETNLGYSIRCLRNN